MIKAPELLLLALVLPMTDGQARLPRRYSPPT